VGPATAERLFKVFGAKVLEVLSGDNAVQQLCKVPKIGKAKAAQIKTSWDNKAGEHRLTIACMSPFCI
jgi:Holliday junction resolvasome RuvABC DNA-binding subunit